MTNTGWVIGLAPWIIQDGNYGDFSVGRKEEFGVRFHTSRTPAFARHGTLSIRHLGGDSYEVCAPVAFVRGDLWMIDVGVLVYNDSGAPKGIREGDWVSGEISLGVDHFAYFEEYGGQSRVPPAIYTWRIRGIREWSARELPSRIVPKDIAWSVREVAETDALGELAELHMVRYELICEKLDDPPMNRLSRQR